MLHNLGFNGLFSGSPARRMEVDEDRKVRLGMLFYVLNDVILSIFLIGSYIFLRGYDTNVRWFPPGTAQPPYVATFIIAMIAVAGAIAFGVAEFALHARAQLIFRVFVVLATLIYLVDLAGQVWLMGRLGFTPQDGAFATSFIMLSGYHVYHMALGVFLGIGVANRAFHGAYLPHLSRYHRQHPDEENGDGHERGGEALPVGERDATALPITTGISAIGYYWFWAALYAVLFWLLIIIQPATIAK